MNGCNFRRAVVFATAAFWPMLANAQTSANEDFDRLMALDRSDLRNEITTRYDAALAQAGDAAVVGADDRRFLWASQAKAQCGIALGYLKSGSKDPVSVGKCADAYNRMRNVAVAPASAPVMAPAPAMPAPMAQPECNKGPFIVFFDWDRADVTPEAATILDSMTATYAGCSDGAVTVAGYADRSGTDRYNQGLSTRRADAVKQYLAARISGAAITAKGFGETNPRVPTEDGVRELQNRRVEISVH